MIKIAYYQQNTHYSHICNIYLFFYTISVSCLFCPVAIVMDIAIKQLINQRSKLVLAILYIHFVGTNLPI